MFGPTLVCGQSKLGHEIMLLPPSHSALPDAYQLEANQEIRRCLMQTRAKISPVQYSQEILDIEKDDTEYAWWIFSDNQFAGITGFCNLRKYSGQTYRSGSIYYAIAKPHRGFGIAELACRAIIAHGFDYLDFEQVTARILSENIASIKLATKLGFSLTSIRHKDYTWRGTPYDVWCGRLESRR